MDTGGTAGRSRPAAERRQGRWGSAVAVRLYLYALVDPPTRRTLGPVGVGAPPAVVRVRPAGALGVVLSEVEGASVALEARDVLAHQEVLGRLLRTRTVLPFRFATLAADWPAVAALVDRIAPNCAGLVERLRGRVEVGLKVLWSRRAVRQEALQALGLHPAAGGAEVSVPRAEAIRAGQAVERIVQGWRDRYVPQILAALRPIAEDDREGGVLGATMLYNASFLVARDREPDFRAAVRALDDRWGDRLEFRYAADLPPYSFVDLRYGGEEEPQ